MHNVAVILRGWLPLAVGILLIGGMIYASVQQVMRQGANDPQIQMAEDAAAMLGNGQPPALGAPVNIAASLAPYLIIFDAQGQAVSGSGRLHGELPTVPRGMLEYARQRGQNRVTWQPEPGVRSATVIASFGGAQPGYVLAGRSLREVEQRDSNLFLVIAAGTLVTLGATLVTAVIVNLIHVPAGERLG